MTPMWDSVLPLLLFKVVLVLVAVGSVQSEPHHFVPKFTHIPEIRAYYDYLQSHPHFLEENPDFYDVLDTGTGWASHTLCSALFVTGLDEETALVEDVSLVRFVVDLSVDYDEKSVTAAYIGDSSYVAKAIYREGAGCTLVSGLTEQEIRDQELGDLSPLPALNDSVEWPLGNYVDPNIDPEIDIERLNALGDEQFSDPIINTRAMLVVYNGKIVYERYKEGIRADMPLIGWSMTKSVTSAFTGLLTEDVGLNIYDPIPVEEWQRIGDDRKNITYEDMLYMASGIRYNEIQVIFCLFDSGGDCATWYAEKRLATEPGSVHEYSTASTTLLMRTLMEQRNMQHLTNFEYPRSRLFSRILMNSALIETQAVGSNPLGGSNMFATPRDWARFGHLYLNDGVWEDGTRIMPEGWVDFTCTSSPQNDGYGAQWGIRTYAGEFTCYMNGFRNQNVFNVFGKHLTVVRQAMPGLVFEGVFDRGAFMEEVIACFP